MSEQWEEAGKSSATPTTQAASDNVQSLLSSMDIDSLRLENNTNYHKLEKECEKLESELIELEEQGTLGDWVDNPTLLGDYATKLRLKVSRLYGFMNVYIDLLSTLELEYGEKRQRLYVEKLAEPKGSPSAAEKHARELTRVDDARIGFIKSSLDQVKNTHNRYNDICIQLQSRMKEFNAERLMG